MSKAINTFDTLVTMVRLQNGNLHDDVNTLLANAEEARDAVAELMDKADNAATALSNLIAARQVDCGYSGVVTDLTAALARCHGGAA